MSPLLVERKVEGGKLFRLRVINSDRGRSVVLTGDFFLEPEEAISVLESRLADCLMMANKDEAVRALSESIAAAQLRISGFEAYDLVDALWEAKR